MQRRGPGEDPSVKEPPLKISGDADRYDHRVGNDAYTQPGNLFRLMNADQQRQPRCSRFAFRDDSQRAESI